MREVVKFDVRLVVSDENIDSVLRIGVNFLDHCLF